MKYLVLCVVLAAGCDTSDLDKPTVPSRYESCYEMANAREGGFNEDWFRGCVRRWETARPADGGAD